jgi:hypothetical protein
MGRWLHSEKDESFLDVTFNSLDFLSDDVETDGLGEGTALSDGDDISDSKSESGRAMGGEGLVTLLKSVVLLDEMEVITSDDNGSLHLVGNNNTLEDFASDGDITGEGAFVIDVVTVNGGLGGLETKSDLLVESNSGAGLLGLEFLGVEENSNLFLVSFLGLNVSHSCSKS